MEDKEKALYIGDEKAGYSLVKFSEILFIRFETDKKVVIWTDQEVLDILMTREEAKIIFSSFLEINDNTIINPNKIERIHPERNYVILQGSRTEIEITRESFFQNVTIAELDPKE